MPEGHLQAPTGGTQAARVERPQTSGPPGDDDKETGTAKGESEVKLRATSTTPDALEEPAVATNEVSRRRASTAEVVLDVDAQSEALAVVRRGRAELEGAGEQGNNNNDDDGDALAFVKDDDGSDSDDEFGDRAIADHLGEKQRRRQSRQQEEEQVDRRGSRRAPSESIAICYVLSTPLTYTRQYYCTVVTVV